MLYVPRLPARSAAGLAATVVLVLCGAWCVGATAARADATAATFASPSQAYWPWVRYNAPATATDAELQNELAQMNAAGISGAEIGQTAFPTTDQMVAELTEANSLGMKLSFRDGPLDAPVGYSINDPNARKGLVFGDAAVNAGAQYSGAIPAPSASSTITTLVAVEAYECAASPCPTTGVVSLNQPSVINLTSTVTGTNTSGINGGTTAGNITWTAPASPAGAQWLLIGFWSRADQAQPDLLDIAGTNELISNLDTNVFTPQIKALLAINGGDIFYDSHSNVGGYPTDTWTNNMAADFQSINGYSLIPFLPAIASSNFNFGGDVADGLDLASRVLNDFYATRQQLWTQNRLIPLQNYVHSLGLHLREQDYGDNTPAVDQIAASAIVDKPETESLWYGDEVDNYLPQASADHMVGNPWYSIECCAIFGQGYRQTFQAETEEMDKAFAGGVTKLVYHYYPYNDSPTSIWPGYSNFGDSFSNAWGPREPFWLDANAYNSYFSRNQEVLSQGSAKVDVAVYLQNYLWRQPYQETPQLRYWEDLGLQQAGYTRDYLDDALLNLPQAAVSGGRLDPSGPAYKAFVIDDQQQTFTLVPGPFGASPGAGNGALSQARTMMSLAAAQKILSFAQAGLPVIIVGTPPFETPGNTPSQDATLQSLMGQLIALPATHEVATEAAVPGLLQSLGITPDFDPSTPGPVLSVHRRTSDTDFYYLYNQGQVTTNASQDGIILDRQGSPVNMTVSLAGSGVPYQLNAWTGQITPIALYTEANGRVTFQLMLAPEETTLIALSTGNEFGSQPTVHAVSTTANQVVQLPSGDLSVRAYQPGTYTTTLSNGQTVTTSIPSVGTPINLTNATWTLNATEWAPANPYGTTFGPAAAQDQYISHNLTLTALTPWTNIPGLANVSGTGTYTTSFNLGSWSGGDGAYLDLGEVLDTFVVTINGQTLPTVNQVSSTVDAGPYLRAGTNTITVRMTTTLSNELRQFDTTQANEAAQNFGLIGPVTITPYGEALITQATTSPGGTVPSTLAISLPSGNAPSLGSFAPGVAAAYTTTLGATVTSTAASAALTIGDPSSVATGHLVNGSYALAQALQADATSPSGVGGPFAPITSTANPLTVLTYSNPVSNDAVTIGFQQTIAATDPLRTGTYSKTLTITLSTNTP